MTRTAHKPSVSAETVVVKGGGRQNSQADTSRDERLLIQAILTDAGLRRSALGIAVLAALIGYGAATAGGLIPAPLTGIAADLETSYDSVYKRVRKLSGMGYVQLSHVMQEKQKRLFLRLVWPQTKPVARKRSSMTKD